jgi:hypothetical protein
MHFGVEAPSSYIGFFQNQSWFFRMQHELKPIILFFSTFCLFFREEFDNLFSFHFSSTSMRLLVGLFKFQRNIYTTYFDAC